MPAKPTGDTPTVHLNLDTLEADAEREPFAFVLGGERFVCRDIEDEDWQVLSKIDEDDPEDTLRLLLGDDYDKFAKNRLPLRKLRKLLSDWREHTGVPAEGESSASSTS